MATAQELTPRVERLECEVEDLKKIFNDYKIESVEKLIKIDERQSQTYKATEDMMVEVKSISNRVSEVQHRRNAEKSKSYDDVLKYANLTLFGYITVRLGLK